MLGYFKKSTTYSSDPDVHLMLEVQKGDRAAFDVLMRKYYARILNFIYRFVGNREISEDLAQDVFLRVYKSASSYRPKSKFQTWLYTIAKNACLNEVRRNKGLFRSLGETLHPEDREFNPRMAGQKSAAPDEDLIRAEKIRVIRVAIQQLPEKQRIAVILRRYEEFSYKDIASTLNISDKAVKSLLNRAKENLRMRLEALVNED